MTDDEKNFIKKINIDKAKNKTNVSIILIILSLLTYVIPLLLGEFDFGIIFEGASFAFLLIARNHMSQYDENRSKMYIIFAMLAIGWILVYDVLLLFSSMQNIIDLVFFGYDYYLSELILILYLMILFAINKDLSKADNPIKYKESTDWFYEKYEEKDNERNKNI